MRTPRRNGSFRPARPTLLAATALALLVPFGAGAATFVVNDLGDAHDAAPGAGGCATALAVCTLRAAIEEANASAGADTISFSVAGAIAPLTALPALTGIGGATIDGTTAPGYASTPVIELNGTGAGPGVDGLVITGGSTTVLGLAINRFGGSGISIYQSNSNRIDSCFIGTDLTGTIDRGNTSTGIGVYDGDDNVIGDAAIGRRNLISGNGSSGIAIYGASARTIVRGNFIGVNATGAAALANDMYGVYVAEASTDTRVGDASGATAYGNLISGNGSSGVGIFGAGTTGTLVQGNFIGLNATLSAAIPNATGVAIDNGATGNTVGGSGTNHFNVISGNTAFGVSIHASNSNTVAHNVIGTDYPGTLDLGNGNSGIQVVDATGCSIGGTGAGNLIVGNGGHGVVLQLGGSHTVSGNVIGLNMAGTTIANDHHGVALIETSGNTIGGTVANSGNLISGNGWEGIYVDGDGWMNVIIGNRIGTNAAGSAAVANRTGIVVNGPPTSSPPAQEFRVRIGGTQDGAGNLISGNTNAGITLVSEVGYCQVWHNIIGLSATGAPLGNGQSGVQIWGGAHHNQIGGSAPSYGNVIGSNGGSGVDLNASTTQNNEIRANLIGTTTAGNAARPNGQHGISITEASSNTIGGIATGAANTISGNTGDGIRITGGASWNMIQSNSIGTFSSTLSALPNGGAGIRIEGGSNNQLGGAAGDGNTIAFNGGNGIELIGALTTGTSVLGNLIGTDPTATIDAGNVGHGVLLSSAPDNYVGGNGDGAGNTIAFNGGDGIAITGPPPCILKTLSRNAVSANDGLGIDLNDDGVTVNDPGDADTGPNNLQNFPDITEATILGSSIHIAGSLSTGAGTYRVEFFSSPACDPSGYGEGAVYLGFTTVAVSETVADFSVELPATVTPGHVVTATATDGSGNTSEFSACYATTALAGAVPATDPRGLAVLAVLLAAAGLAALRARPS